MESWEILAFILQVILAALPFVFIMESEKIIPWIKNLFK